MKPILGLYTLLTIANFGCSSSLQVLNGSKETTQLRSAKDAQGVAVPMEAEASSQEKGDEKLNRKQDKPNKNTTSGSVGESTHSPEDSVADRPQPISGMFLVCEKSNKISCFLREDGNKRYTFKSAPELTVLAFDSTPSLVSVSSRWLVEHVKFDLEITGAVEAIRSVKNIKVNIKNKEMDQVFVAEFSTAPVHLGDSSPAAYEGCTQDSVDAVKDLKPMTEFKMTFRTLEQSTEGHLLIKRSCGFGQTGRVALYLGTTLISEQPIMPTSNGEEDREYRLAPLIGDTEYSVVISSGLKSPGLYDHALFWSTAISY